MNKTCNKCEYLSINEFEQDYIVKHGGNLHLHICTKYNKRVLHYPYKEPLIHPCEECLKEH